MDLLVSFTESLGLVRSRAFSIRRTEDVAVIHSFKSSPFARCHNDRQARDCAIGCGLEKNELGSGEVRARVEERSLHWVEGKKLVIQSQ